MSEAETLPPEKTEAVEKPLAERVRLWIKHRLPGRNHDNSLKEALEEVLEEHQEDGEKLPEEEKTILKKALTFGDLKVSDIMIPRTDIKAVEYNTPLEELKTHLIKHFHTRVPVYNDTLDNIKGFIHIKDMLPLFASDKPFNMAFVLREMLFVPPSMKLSDLLVRMRKAGGHIAIVVDEYGGTDGLVTLEDVFEEIVGDIQDEHDEDETEDAFAWNAHGYCDVSARARIDKLGKELDLVLGGDDENANYDTLGGLIFYKLGHVPVPGERIEHEGDVQFEIISADARFIKKVRIFRP
jgi:CBS domain containing-hemolysin-like protein